MRIANLAGRATIVTDEGILDVATGSNGAFSSSLDRCIAQLDTLKVWFDAAQPDPSEHIKPTISLATRAWAPLSRVLSKSSPLA